MTLATVPRSNVTMVMNTDLHILSFCLFPEIPSVFATKIGLGNISRERKTNNLDKLFYALMSEFLKCYSQHSSFEK